METTIYSHTGTQRPTDIGPGNGGALHSITILEPGPNNAGSLIVRDGGRHGRVVFQFEYAAKNFPLPELKWENLPLKGQLNVTLSHRKQQLLIEMSDENPSSILSTDSGNDEELSSILSDDPE